MHPDNVTKIASDLGVSETEVVSMNRRLSGGDASLNAMISADGESSMEWQDWLEDEDADQASDYELKDELSLRRDMLNSAMHGLNERERDILTQRRLVDEVQTLEELSETYGISRERVRQIEVRAFEKLQEKMREMALEKGILSE
jgi:RNA polymerase sigma-32 factor